MTEITLLRNQENIISVRAKGHSGCAPAGEDIVCAAVSAILQTALLGLTDFLKIDAKAEMKDGFLSFSAEGINDAKTRESANVILETMRLGLLSAQLSAPCYLKINERRC